MLAIIWITLFTIGAAQIGLLLQQRLPAVLGSILGMALWLVVALGALNLQVVSGGTLAFEQAVQPLAYLALAPLLVNGIFLFADATGQLPTGETGPEAEI
jgi:hypothetical protein